MRGDIEDGLREDLAVGGDHKDRGIEQAETVVQSGVAEGLGLEHGDIKFERGGLDRWWLDLPSPAHRAIRLGDNGDHRHATGNKCTEGRHRKRGRAHEDYANRRARGGRHVIHHRGDWGGRRAGATKRGVSRLRDPTWRR